MSTERPQKALVVEDEFLVAMTLCDLVEEMGFAVLGPAARLEDALKLAQDPQIEFGFLDINLAGERSWPVARELKRRGIPFAFVSGYEAVQAEMPEDLRDAPICSKPLDIDRLRICVARAADQQAGR